MSRRLIAWFAFVGLVAAIAYASRAATGTPDRNALYEWATAANALFTFAIILGVTLAITGRYRHLLAIRRPRSWPRALATAVPLFVGVFLLVSALDRVLHGSKEQGLVPKHWEPAHAAAFGVNFAAVAIVAPITEELLFRGLGYSLLERYGRWFAIVVVGVAFGVYHGLVHALPELAVFGCALAWLRSRTDSVLPGMLMHAAFNTIGVLSVFF
jgi:membrane protease YdiL (CAAX protease family)